LSPDPRREDVVVALTYYSPYVSGLTNMARDIAEGLAARGRRVTVVTSRYDSSLPREEEINGVRVLRAPVIVRLGRGVVSPHLIRLARSTIRRATVGALHLPMLEAGAIAAGMPTPLVATYHCDVTLPPGVVNTLQRTVVDASNRMAMRRSAAVTVTSEDYAPHSRMWPEIEPSMAVVPPPCATPARHAELAGDRWAACRVPRPDRA
jgi:Glycosyl transferase 4-like domain